MRNEKAAWSSILVAVVLLALGVIAEAQQPSENPADRIPSWRIASLTVNPPRTEAFRQGLRELGYVEGKNIAIEYRFADGKLDRLPVLVAELVGLKVDVIVTAGPGSTRPAKEATSTIPIVMAQDPDPVGNGFVASLERPGGNITGLATFAPELSGKRLELLKETVPKLSRVAVLRLRPYPARTNVKRDGARRKGARSAASIPRRTRGQGY